MKLFATSDIHGNRTIMNKLTDAAGAADMVVICGDVGGKGSRCRTLRQFSDSQLQDADALCDILSRLPVPSRFILGNDDWFDYESPFCMTAPETLLGSSFIPFEYVALTPFNTNREANENKLEFELDKLPADHNSIILAHTPPYGAGDILLRGGHCGSLSVRRWIQAVQPKIWLCGHIHEDYSAHMIGETHVFNCACWNEDDMLRGWLIDTDTLEFEKVLL